MSCYKCVLNLMLMHNTVYNIIRNLIMANATLTKFQYLIEH